MKLVDPLTFFSWLKWLDGRPLLDVIEPYRRKIFTEALYTLEENRPRYNLVVTSRAKKNWKSTDLVLAALYRLLVWGSPLGNQCYILANDQDQAGDDLTLAKALIRVNPVLKHEVKITHNEIARLDGKGFLKVLPAQDVAGAHGKTYLFCGFDEIHEYRDWALLEAMQLDPHRSDALMWITSYASLYNYPGVPLHDLCSQGRAGQDPRMYFSWYAADYCTDQEFLAKETPEERANPSTLPDGYLEQQKKRLPTHKYRRLHLNLPGSPEGAYLAPERVEAAIGKYRILPFEPGPYYRAFVDMSGGSGDDSALAIAHNDHGLIIVDGVWTQGQRPPFDPRGAVKLFADILEGYRVSHVVMDRYAGETFRQDFLSHGIGVELCPVPKSVLYEAFEVELNSGRVILPEEVTMIKQFLTLVVRGGKIDHPSGEHDDLANTVAGVIYLLKDQGRPIEWSDYFICPSSVRLEGKDTEGLPATDGNDYSDPDDRWFEGGKSKIPIWYL